MISMLIVIIVAAVDTPSPDLVQECARSLHVLDGLTIEYEKYGSFQGGSQPRQFYRERGTVSRAQGMVRFSYESRPGAADSEWEDLEKDGASRADQLWNGQKHYDLRTLEGGSFPVGTKFQRQRLFVSNDHDRATQIIRNSPVSALYGQFPGAQFSLASVLEGQAAFSVRSDQEVVNGIQCHVLELKIPGGIVHVWVSPSKGFGISKLYAEWNPNPNNATGPGVQHNVYEYNVNSFRQIDEKLIPESVSYHFTQLIDGSLHSEFETQLKLINLDRLRPASDRDFKLDVPNGTAVELREMPTLTGLTWEDGEISAQIDPTSEELLRTLEMNKSTSVILGEKGAAGRTEKETLPLSDASGEGNAIPTRGPGKVIVLVAGLLMLTTVVSILIYGRYRKVSTELR